MRFADQGGVVDADGTIGQRHGYTLESLITEAGDGRFNPSPGEEKDGPHGDTDGATVQRVARLRGEQGGIDAQGRS